MEKAIIYLFVVLAIITTLIVLHFISVCILYIVYRCTGGKMRFFKYLKYWGF